MSPKNINMYDFIYKNEYYGIKVLKESPPPGQYSVKAIYCDRSLMIMMVVEGEHAGKVFRYPVLSPNNPYGDNISQH